MDLSNLGSNKTGDAEPAFPWCRQRNWTYWLVLKSRRRKAGIPPHDPKFRKKNRLRRATPPEYPPPEEYAQLVAKLKYPSS